MHPYTETLEALKDFESFRERAYQDPAGVWTIGFGTTHWSPGHRVKRGDRITRADALIHLDHDLRSAWLAMMDVVQHGTVPQMAALASLAHNVGWIRLTQSRLVAYHNATWYAAAADEFLHWNKARGTILPGLVRRRIWERAMYISGSPGPSEPKALVPS